MKRLHLGVIEEEIAAANQLPMSDPNRVERLKELSRRQMAVQNQKFGCADLKFAPDGIM